MAETSRSVNVLTPRAARPNGACDPDSAAAQHLTGQQQEPTETLRDSGNNGESCGRVCEYKPAECAPSVPSGPSQDPNTGRFLPGHLAALTHGLRSDRLPAEYAHLQAEVQAFVSDCLSDEGGGDSLSRRRRALLDYRARLHRRIQQLDTAIEIRGLFDKRGKLRVAWVQRLEGLIGTARQLDGVLGLQRQAKRIPSLADVMQEDL